MYIYIEDYTLGYGTSEKLKKVISGITLATKICIRHKSMRRLLSWINIHYDGSPSVLAGLNAINLRVAMLSAKSIKYIHIQIYIHHAYTKDGILFVDYIYFNL